jgi:hypothetical protein
VHENGAAGGMIGVIFPVHQNQLVDEKGAADHQLGPQSSCQSNNDKGLGTDGTHFFALLFGKTVGRRLFI